MSDTITLEAQLREKVGKGAARAVRLQGLTPAVIYGNKKEPVSITLDTKGLTKTVLAGGFKSKNIEITVDGKKETVVARDIQFHPVKDTVRHVDFLRVAGK